MSSNEATSDGIADEYGFVQTQPLALSKYDGADHNHTPKLTFDETAAPDDIDAKTVEDLNWAVDAIAGIITAPHLALWVRTGDRHLLVAHQPNDDHERAGLLRAAGFDDTNERPPELTTDTEFEAGLLTAFNAFNAVYDIILDGAYGWGYEIVLADIAYLEEIKSVTHPILSHQDGLHSWGRYNAKTFPVPKDRGRTAFRESVYPDSGPTISKHGHARAQLELHTRPLEPRQNN